MPGEPDDFHPVRLGSANGSGFRRRGSALKPVAADRAHLLQEQPKARNIVAGQRWFPGSMARFHDILTIEPGKRGGKPCIRGMRITVYDVLSYLAAGMAPEEILADFPYLTRDDILACLEYAAERERQMLVAHG